MTEAATDTTDPAAPGEALPLPGTFSVFRKRDFRLLWTAQLVSTIGTGLTDLAAGILVFKATGSALSVGLMFMATAVPTLIVGLIAGVFVDRYDRRKIMVISDLARAAIVVAIPFLISINIALLYVAVAAVSTISQFFNPANDALLPEVATDDELAAANSWIMISSFGSTSVGFALSGLLATIDIDLAFWLDAITFVFSALLLIRVRVGKIETADETSIAVVVSNLKDGIATLVGTPTIRNLLLTGLPVFISFGLWNVLLLPFALDALHATTFEYGLQEGLTSVGFVVGSLMMAKWANSFREGTWIVVAGVAMGITGVLYGFSTSIWTAIALVTISGFFNAPQSISRRVLLQRQTPREMRGRVFSAFAVARDVTFLIGIGAAGLADVIDVRLLVVGSSVLLLLGGVWAWFVPGIGRPAKAEQVALSVLQQAEAAPVPARATLRPATLADFDRLAGHLSGIGRLDAAQRSALVEASTVRELEAGATIVNVGDAGDAAYFILDGRAAAGTPEQDGSYRSLSTMEAGDFFGEIAALTGSRRTATVVAEQPTTIVEVPAPALRALMAVPELSSIFLTKLTERLSRTNQADLPRFSGVDQASLKDLRTPRPASEALPKSY
ncbi:MAG TPA: MFS transporter [Candidatus Limnocylindrales bacterium]|nr:MFS transporter [Candidatus Limnocylindrales bacterium]